MMTDEVLHSSTSADQPGLKIVDHDTVMLATDAMSPHPLNRPATGIKAEQVETLKTLIEQNGYNASKPITVRAINGSGYQIIEGHHRWAAARALGFAQLPCVVEDLDDVETNLRLLMSNQQEGNDPLDIGINALETVEKGKHGSGMNLSSFAKRIGKSPTYITQVTHAASVYRQIFSQLKFSDTTGRVQHLFEIHAAPETTWATLARLVAEKEWSVKETKAAVDRVNGVATQIPQWWPFSLESEYPRIASEPGHAKAVAAALKAMSLAFDRLPDSATLYRLEATQETREIEGREHRRFIPQGFTVQPRDEFISALRAEENRLSAKVADSISRRLIEEIQHNSTAREEWRPLLTDEEEAQRRQRLEEIARLSERERFMPRVLHGDVVDKLRGLPDEWFDLVCVDPPYNMDKEEWDSFGSGRQFAEWAQPWIAECSRVLKDSGALYVFGINRMLSHLQGALEAAGLQYRNWIIWDTIQGAGGGLWVNRHEAILYYSKTSATYEDAESIKLERHEENVREYKGKEYAFKNPSNVWRFPCVDEKHPERTSHPTQKPVELIERIIKASCPSDGRVLDCFLGSGTTGVACMRLRRLCTGIDNNEDYLSIAQARFDATEVGE